MASLEQIRDALANTINANTAMEVYCYATVPDKIHLPAVVIEPTYCDFEGAMGRGLDLWDFNLFVLVTRGDSETGQDQLDQLVSGSGPNSIRRILFERDDLGLDQTEATCYSMHGYGGKHEWFKVEHVGAILKVRVITDGRA